MQIWLFPIHTNYNKHGQSKSKKILLMQKMVISTSMLYKK